MIIIPAGTQTDGASTPHAPAHAPALREVLEGGDPARPSGSQRAAPAGGVRPAPPEAMESLGVDQVTGRIIYGGVVAGGQSSSDEDRKNQGGINEKVHHPFVQGRLLFWPHVPLFPPRRFMPTCPPGPDPPSPSWATWRRSPRRPRTARRGPSCWRPPSRSGRWNDEYIAGADLGVLGNVKPDTLGQAGSNFTAGVSLPPFPLLRSAMPKISPNHSRAGGARDQPSVSHCFRNRAENVKPGIEVLTRFGLVLPGKPQTVKPSASPDVAAPPTGSFPSPVGGHCFQGP